MQKYDRMLKLISNLQLMVVAFSQLIYTLTMNTLNMLSTETVGNIIIYVLLFLLIVMCIKPIMSRLFGED